VEAVSNLVRAGFSSLSQPSSSKGTGAWKRPLTAILIAIIILILACARPPERDAADFYGTALTTPDAAPDFSLTDQLGRPVSLHDMRGNVVALTFLYTHCPDVCPIVTSQLRDVQATLGDDSASVRFVAVSVDPERDTQQAAREYLGRWRLDNGWRFAVGEREALSEVWASYYVEPYAEVAATDVGGPGAAAKDTAVATVEPSGALDALSAQIAERFTVIHGAPVFLIDRAGMRRVVFTPPLEPDEVAADIRLLLE
ncbi:MAG: SCO family protein, partial [Nitrospinae bacterium]|nr:SCO family protein [Nitrospinota bacterium]